MGCAETTGGPAARSRREEVGRPSSEEITLEIDASIMAWFRQHEDDPEAAINAALREHMERERRAS